MTPVILVMSLEGTIQLLNQYLIARALGLSGRAAPEQAHPRMRTPCFNAALTAAIGFASLLTLPIPAIRDFGLFTALGIMIGYGLTIALTPLLLACLPDLPPRVIYAFEAGPVARWLSEVVRSLARHRAPPALAVVVLFVLSVRRGARIHEGTGHLGLRGVLGDGPEGHATLRIHGRVPALGTGASQALFAQIRQAADRVGLPDVSLTGNFVVFSNMSTTLVRHQVQGLAVALVLILGGMAAQFPSIRPGLLCAIPTGAPALLPNALVVRRCIALPVHTALILIWL